MARSYRKPYSAVTGVRSAHADKTQAARSVRRAQDSALRSFKGSDWDEFLMPDMYECSDNDVWGWGRDGNQYLCEYPTQRMLTVLGIGEEDCKASILRWSWEYYTSGKPLRNWEKLQRK